MPNHDSSSGCTRTFTDRHIHGIAGVDFATSHVAEIRAALELLAARRTTGVTASLPTVTVDVVAVTLDRLRGVYAAGALNGVHLEGPFLASDYAGAHPHRALLAPDSSAGRAFLETVLEHQSVSSMVTMMTVAPELTGFEELAARLVHHGIEPALGHTGATYEQMLDGIDAVHALTGRPVVITHLYNAMRGFHHRDPGPLLAVLEAAQSDRVIVELIADGHHVDFELIRWWFQHYPGAVRLVSDASAATNVADRGPLVEKPPRLGHVLLRHDPQRGPRLATGSTIASGGQDLLAIHEALVAAGFDHELICAAMR